MNLKPIIFACLFFFGNPLFAQKFFNKAVLTAETHLNNMVAKETDPLVIPRSLFNDGSFKSVDMYDWTSGFFAGNLWYGYELSENTNLKQEAIKWTKALEPIKFYTENHDLGFMAYCSFGNAYRLTKETYYKDVLIEAAKSLATRYNPTVKAIKSWNDFPAADSVNIYNFPVIIDNMMNLELLFFASKESGNPYFKDIAIAHANTTIKHHFREDYSTYHVLCYDTLTAKPIVKETNQGYAHESAWSRGQAWGLYGFTVCYRETKDPQYLQQAEKIAQFIINHPNLPKDGVPYWDYHVNQPNYKPVFNYQPNQYPIVPRDASAAAITSSALFELSKYSKESAQLYEDFAIKILKSLSKKQYLAKPQTNHHFILKHSVGSLPHNKEVNVPLVYADYYYLEALLRYQALK
ncbi:glycoside hydrolase family 88 protein [Pedobacter glucosidilyticus]|uniref:glycoside hydrolase family 88 protein n=1 Tax=Pedobacter glucosidilyticus TaxID=1122941 RepID=UPI0003F676E7|nr:glycoside hydrolase family 88 protein [Pedobacter glucosidilyticus]